MKSIGIDIGTSHTVAAVWNGEEAVVIRDDQGNREIPSLVSFEGSGRYIGASAETKLTSNPENTLFGFNRLLGRTELFENDTKIMRRQRREKTARDCEMQVTYGGVRENFTPEEITAMLISHVRMIALRGLKRGQDIKRAAIAVPDTFTDVQRRAIETACRITGLKVLGVINQTTAAAIAYGYQTISEQHSSSQSTVGSSNSTILRNPCGAPRAGHSGGTCFGVCCSAPHSQGVSRNLLCSHLEEDRTIMVINLGGSHLGISVVRVHDNKFQVLSDSQGIDDLGGQDFTESMVDDFIGEFETGTGIHFEKKNEKANIAALRMKCEKAKINLSHMRNNQMDEPESIFLPKFTDGKDLDVEITRTKFEALNSEKFERILSCIKEFKRDSQKIQEVVLVGGSTRIPMLRNRVEELFKTDKIPIKTDLNAVHAVAQGTAIYAASLTGLLPEKICVSAKGPKFTTAGGHAEMDNGQWTKNSVPKTEASCTTGDDQIAPVTQPLKSKKNAFKALRNNVKRIDALDNKWKQNTDRLSDLEEDALSVKRLFESSLKAPHIRNLDLEKCTEILSWIENSMEKSVQDENIRKIIRKKENSATKLRHKYQKHKAATQRPEATKNYL